MADPKGMIIPAASHRLNSICPPNRTLMVYSRKAKTRTERFVVRKDKKARDLLSSLYILIFSAFITYVQFVADSIDRPEGQLRKIGDFVS